MKKMLSFLLILCIGVFTSVGFASNVIDKEAVELVSLDTDVDHGVISVINLYSQLELEGSVRIEIEKLYNYDLKDFVSFLHQEKRFDRLIYNDYEKSYFNLASKPIKNSSMKSEPPLYILRN